MGLVVLSGGAIIAAVGALAAATTVVGTAVAGVVLAAEVAGLYFGVKALADYSQDSDEEALFKEVALGYLFLGIGKAVEKGFRMWKASRAADEAVEVLDEGSSASDEVVEAGDEVVDTLDEGAEVSDEVVEAGDEIADKFDELSKDPQTSAANQKSIDEAEAVLQAETDGIVNNPTRPNLKRGEPNLDFKIDGPPPYKWVDIKTPVNRGNLDKMAEGIGKKIPIQKGGSTDVLHIIDLKNIPAAQKAKFQQKVIDTLGNSEGVEFINNI